MNLSDLRNKRICILGLGSENRALVDFLIAKKVPCEIIICDAKKNIENGWNIKNISFNTGVNYDRDLSQYDLISRIAGYPLFSEEIKKAKRSKKEITSPIKLFFDFCPTKNIIGVTGTKGKGTTSSLITAILKKAGKRVFLGGNIGVPVFSFINKIKKNDWVVLELSSFQLEDLEKSPRIAVITNLYKEHLAPADPNNPNYHKSFNNYKSSKLNILKFQNINDIAVLPLKLKEQFKNFGNGKKICFEKSGLKSRLLGEHNKENIAAAELACQSAGIKKTIIAEAVAQFKGLEYRLEFIKNKNGVSYYNDSFSTTPENTIAALNSFSTPVILLAGGAEKNSDFRQMAKAIKNKTKDLILFSGPSSERIKSELLDIKYPAEKINMVDSMEKAIILAQKNAKKGDTILLSPGCASFGLFKNYKHRGNLFREIVTK